MAQLSLFKNLPPPVYGGTIYRKRKSKRPLSRKRPLHLVLKARNSNLYRHKDLLENQIRDKAERFGLTPYGSAVNFDHVHMILRIPGRREYVAFIKALTGVLARKLGKKLWKLLPFTRVMNWGRDFKQGLEYLRKNREEAAGERVYEPRKDWYSRWR